jgi:hypothetical protein
MIGFMPSTGSQLLDMSLQRTGSWKRKEGVEEQELSVMHNDFRRFDKHKMEGSQWPSFLIAFSVSVWFGIGLRVQLDTMQRIVCVCNRKVVF